MCLARAEDAPAIVLQVTPHICVLSAHEAQCRQQLEVRWTALDKQPRSLCLYQQGLDQPLSCWTQVPTGQANIEAQLTETTVYELRQSAHEPAIAQGWVQILYAQKRISQRRNPWSFF